MKFSFSRILLKKYITFYTNVKKHSKKYVCFLRDKKKIKKKTESVSKKEVRKNEKMHEKSPECHSFK